MDYQVLFNIAFGCLSVVAGWFFKVLYDTIRSMEKEVNELEDNHEEDHREVIDKINDLALTLPEKYVSKSDFDNLIKMVHHRFDRLEEKLESFRK
jgi:hypothetical protein